MLIDRDKILKQLDGRPADSSLPIAVFRKMLMDADVASYDELVNVVAASEPAAMVEYYTKVRDLYKHKLKEETNDQV